MSLEDRGRIEDALRRIDELLTGLSYIADPAAQSAARELVQAILDVHGIALARIMASFAMSRRAVWPSSIGSREDEPVQSRAAALWTPPRRAGDASAAGARRDGVRDRPGADQDRGDAPGLCGGRTRAAQRAVWRRGGLAPLATRSAGTIASVTVPAFTDECVIDLPVGCSYDFNLAATKYFYGLEAGEFLCCCCSAARSSFATARATCRSVRSPNTRRPATVFPVGTWRALMERYYSGTVPLSLSREVFDEVYRFKRRHALASWDDTVRLLLEKGRAEGTRS